MGKYGVLLVEINLEFLMALCYNNEKCRVSLSVEFLLPKQTGRVRLPYPAPNKNTTFWVVFLFGKRESNRFLSNSRPDGVAFSAEIWYTKEKE